jgi:hypothetical protein
MRQEHLAAAVAGQLELILDNCGLFRIGDRGTVKVGALAVCIALELLEPALVVEPLVGQELATIHTANRDDHLAV